MNNKLENVLLPLNKQGDLDQRFKASIKRIMIDMSSEAAQVLSDFYIKTSELQKSASKAGLELVEAINKESDRLSSREHRHPDDEYGWMGKALRKSTVEILKKVGFKEKNASKIIKAAEFKQSLRTQSSWSEQLSVSHLSELGRMNEAGIRQAIAESSSAQTIFIGTEFGGIPGKNWIDVPVRRFEEIRRFNPKTIRENNPLSELDRISDHQDILTIESLEVKEATQEAIAREIASLAQQLNTKEVWREKEIVEILKEAEHELISIGHMVMQPLETVPSKKNEPLPK